MRPSIIRLFQDISSYSGQLPDNYWLTDIEETDLEHIGHGGEALIHKAVRVNGALRVEVALRMHDPPKPMWSSQNGKDLIQVRWAFLFILYSQLEFPVQQIHREIITHRQLSHPNVLPFLGVLRGRDHPLVIVTPYLPNGNAVNYIKNHYTPQSFMKIVSLYQRSSLNATPNACLLGFGHKQSTELSSFNSTSSHSWRYTRGKRRIFNLFRLRALQHRL